jgi:signal transduction histidine kinase
LGEVTHAVQHIADEKHLALEIDCPKKLALETDRKRLYQVVLNVVSNALKYTEQGKVKVTASINDKQVMIAVEDTGIGMNEAGLANLFKPFERAESRLRVKTLGTGLGLYLTRKILTQLLGGSIEVKSKPEQGSTFTVYLPAKMPPIIAKVISSILEEHPE